MRSHDDIPDDICVAMVCEGLVELAQHEKDVQQRKIMQSIYLKLCLENYEWEELEYNLNNRDILIQCYRGIKYLYDEDKADKFVLEEMLNDLDKWIKNVVKSPR